MMNIIELDHIIFPLTAKICLHSKRDVYAETQNAHDGIAELKQVTNNTGLR
ncbi:MAG TPA: hypothetical protein VGN53_11390 [Klebsiella sp.]|jgi:hypothetical protein